MQVRRGARIAAVVALCALAALGPLGCARKVTGVGGGPGQAPPGPTSSTATLRLLERAFEARSIGQYRPLFTADYTFHLSPGDSSRSTTTWLRDDELRSAAHLFAGGNADQPPAVDGNLAFDRILVAMPDPRFMAWDPAGRWHATLQTHAALSVRMSDGQVIAFASTESFSLVRGDSAVVPLDLGPGEFAADSLHWYIRRWEELTLQPRTTPITTTTARDAHLATPMFAVPPELISTWGRLKLIYW
jgi:hypothetical protein